MSRRPSGASAAVSFTFDLDAEEVWIGEDPRAIEHPVTLSQGHYGPRVGLPLILETLRRHDAMATFFVPGRVAENYPEAVETIQAAGHEVAHHGYTHRTPAALTYAEEVEEFERSVAALRAFGVEPGGYRAPSWDISVHTLAVAEQFGFRYSSNFMSDIRPFHHRGSSLVEVPVHWVLDDAAHFWFSGDTWTKKISTNTEVNEIFTAEQQGIARLAGCVVYTFHPQIIGRPGRIELLDRTIGNAMADPTLWVTTTSEIADEAREQAT
jgi:peptidoglycan-N-acetylglucosamine deacetylase